MSERIYAAIDLEMTGLKPGLDEIIEVGVVRCTPERVIERWSTLVQPLESPRLRVQRITGITPDMLAEAPPWSEVEDKLRSLLDGCTLLGHNVGFDESFLEVVGIKSASPSIDTLPLAQIIEPGAPSHRLGDLCDRFNIELTDAHRALADAEAARLLFLQLKDRYALLPQDARNSLSELAAGANIFWGPGRVLREWSLEVPRTPASPSSGARSAEPHRPLEPVDLPRGTLAELTAQAFAAVGDDDFEQRPEQLDMARDVAESLQFGGTLIVEAGTGTGKSLAYLVPAALWALKTGSTVIVSTHTINLQQQLESKDVEFARKLIAGVSAEASKALTSTVVKGRDHYLCQQKLDRELGKVVDWEDPLVLARAAVWRSTSPQGDRAELRLPVPKLRSWEKLSARGTGCLSDRTCDYAMNGTCFLLRVQRQAASSHIVIANHALLVRAMASGAITMPDAPVVIVDESHALEDVATDQLSLEMSESWMFETLQRCAEGSDALTRLAEHVGLREEADRLSQHTALATSAVETLFDGIGAFVSEYSEDRRASEDRVTLSQGARGSNDWSDLELQWEETRDAIADVCLAIEAIAETCDEQAREAGGEERRRLHSVTTEAQGVLAELSERRSLLGRAISEYSSEEIAWASRENRKTGASIVHAAPLSVAAHLKPLWQERHATVLTGATLATSTKEDAAFDFLRERLGIEDAAEAQYGSAFDYQRRCRIYLPTDMADATDNEHHDSVAAAVRSLAVAAGGRTMVLFRSYGAMNQVTRRVQKDLEQAGLVLVRQGRDGTATNIVELLRNDPKTVAFGVAALWTGVDIPGDALSLLIMTRLPFAPPNDPVLKARGEQYDNEFMQFSLPAAILQFRQGIGRLIRTQSDLGAAVILDGRIVSRRYGKRFLDALPPAPVIRKATSEIARELQTFLPPNRDSK